MNFTLYTLGDLSSMTAMLNAVAMVFNDPIFNEPGSIGGSAIRLMFLTVLAGVLLAGMQSMWKNGQGSPIIMLTMFALWTTLGFTKTTVVVQDLYTGGSTTVDNVPLIVAVPGGIFTTVGQAIGERMQTAFSSADATAPALSTTGFVNPLAYILSLRRVMSSGMQPHIYNSLRYYAADCVLASDNAPPNLFNSYGTLHELLADDAFHDGFTSIFTTTYPRGTLESCLNASTYLMSNMSSWAAVPLAFPATNNMLTTGIGNNILQGAGEIGKGAVLTNGGGLGAAAVVSPTSTDASNVGQVLLDALGRTSAAAASDVAEISASLAFLPGFVEGLMCGTPTPGATMADVNTCALMSSDQDELARMTEASKGGGFGRVAISFMGVFQAIWIGLAPLIMLTILGHGPRGPQIFGAYLMLGLWVVSWLPVAYMVNYYIDLSFRQAVAQLGGSGGTFTLSQTYSLYRVAADKISLASELMGSVPILTMAVLTGSIYAMTKVAGVATRGEGIDAHAAHQTAAARQIGLVATNSVAHQAGHRMDLARAGVAPLNYNVGDAASQSVTSAQESVRAAEAAHTAVKEQAFKDMLKSGKVDGQSQRFGDTVERAYKTASESSNQFMRDIGKSNALSDAEKVDFTAQLTSQAKASAGGVITSEGIEAALRNTKSISADRQTKTLRDLKSSAAYKNLDSSQRSAAASLSNDDISSLESGQALEVGTSKGVADSYKQIEAARSSLASAEAWQKSSSSQRSFDTANLRREIMNNDSMRYPLQGLNQAVIAGDKAAIARFFYGNDDNDHSANVDRFLAAYAVTQSEIGRINPDNMNEEGWRGVTAMHAALKVGMAGAGEMRDVVGGEITGKPAVAVDTTKLNTSAAIDAEREVTRVAALEPDQFDALAKTDFGGPRNFSYADLDHRATAAARRTRIDPADSEAHTQLKTEISRVELDRHQAEANYQQSGLAVDGGKRYAMTKEGLVGMTDEAVGDLAIFNVEMAKAHPVLFGVAVADMAVGTGLKAIGQIRNVGKMAKGAKPSPPPASMADEIKQLGAQQDGTISKQQAGEIFEKWIGGDPAAAAGGSRAGVPGSTSALAAAAGIGAVLAAGPRGADQPVAAHSLGLPAQVVPTAGSNAVAPASQPVAPPPVVRTSARVAADTIEQGGQQPPRRSKIEVPLAESASTAQPARRTETRSTAVPSVSKPSAAQGKTAMGLAAGYATHISESSDVKSIIARRDAARRG